MSKSIYNIIREISFIISGSLISLLFIPFEEKVGKYSIHIITLILFFLLLGMGLFEWPYKLYQVIRKFINVKRKTIAIFAPYNITMQNSSWLEISYDDISKLFKNKGLRYKRERKESVYDFYKIIVNPYGGTYPENNISNLRSLDRIFSFVRNGGVYINIADIPFYYAYDSNLRRRVDTTPLSGGLSSTRSFLETLLVKRLHIFTFRHIGENNKDMRIISLTDNSKNLYIKAYKINYDGKEYKCSPFLAIPYGKGYFVFSTFPIKQSNKEKLLEIIRSALKLLKK